MPKKLNYGYKYINMQSKNEKFMQAYNETVLAYFLTANLLNSGFSFQKE
jgi:hypothetical protein